MAAHAQEPKVPKANKPEWWAVSHYLWGYMDPSEFGKKPDFNPLRGSKSKFVFETRQPQASAPNVGRVVVRTRFCMCTTCRPSRDGPGQGGDFMMPCSLKDNAAFRNIVGTTTDIFCRQLKTTT